MSIDQRSEAREDVKSVTLARLQSLVFGQANVLFPKRTQSKAFLKLYEELGEVIKNPSDPLEWADVFIMLLDLSKMNNIDVVSAILHKMQINQERVWTETPTGTYQHVVPSTSTIPAPSVGWSADPLSAAVAQGAT
jgi:hypothetical protein